MGDCLVPGICPLRAGTRPVRPEVQEMQLVSQEQILNLSNPKSIQGVLFLKDPVRQKQSTSGLCPRDIIKRGSRPELDGRGSSGVGGSI